MLCSASDGRGKYLFVFVGCCMAGIFSVVIGNDCFPRAVQECACAIPPQMGIWGYLS